jgi:hypothetical protein
LLYSFAKDFKSNSASWITIKTNSIMFKVVRKTDKKIVCQSKYAEDVLAYCAKNSNGKEFSLSVEDEQGNQFAIF